jgi:hypothetical protein
MIRPPPRGCYVLVQACQPVLDLPEGASQCPTRVLCVVVGMRASAVYLSVSIYVGIYGSKVWDITIFRSDELLWTARGGTV